MLIANRGEIAVRVARSVAARGLRSVAVYTPDDAAAVHVRAADVAVAVPSYLDPGALLAAARAAGADAVHPGYGFLSEHPAFARAVVDAGLVWIGPPPDAVELMGDKIRAKRAVAAAGVPVVPGTDHTGPAGDGPAGDGPAGIGPGDAGLTDDQLVAAADAIGFPVLVKPSAGGGGKGMRRVDRPDDLPAALAAARREAAGAFGDDTLLLERWVPRPRHVEVQVFADTHGAVVHLGDRECSLQRRHQKIVEESPSPLLDQATRDRIGEAAVAVARSCGYVGAGTVEFIVSADQPDRFFFLEMNTRLQVEHPVTEAVTGIDLVDWQLRVAAGEPLPLRQDQVACRGHAVEARIYAEDPRRDFVPSAGTVAVLDQPTGRPGIRVDTALAEGAAVGTGYDPLLAKVIAWAPDRAAALDRLRQALAHTTVLGVTTNVGFLVALLGHPDVAAGRLDTELVGRVAAGLTAPGPDDAEAAVVAGCVLAAGLDPTGSGGGEPAVLDPWDLPDGWRLGGAVEPAVFGLVAPDGPVAVAVCGRPAAGGASVSVDGGPPVAVAALPVPTAPAGRDLLVTVHGVTSRWARWVGPDAVWVGRAGRAWRFGLDRGPAGGRSSRAAAAGPVASPMPGTVVAVHVAAGDRVAAGQPLVAVEAMKMEHVVRADVAGTVKEVLVHDGDAVALDQPLAVVDRDGGDPAITDRDGDGVGA
ncbi:MAG TPA: biotin carboxylase N-terminal domain-containing protein [Acidimicrobiales bacterium]|nr:biotin carboxylase N-terminal domain-containing protein [Acidimicrobiales bacterium]